ncbi:hypothetical protein [Treponema sp.]|uniref:hypothetical protein n=1 Tax=Treponema sp. TaxID=166 RepID=UPI00298D7533|nr:hypothetical protein [Treponema sp.]MCR5612128.1 hypothetical protein [Treponema sp.]
MVQFYFLLILLLILTGVILIASDSSTEIDSDNFNIDSDNSAKGKIHNVKASLENDSILSNETFCLVTGALCTLIGFIKLFFAYSKTGKGIPVVGDLLPSLLAMAGGLTVVLEYYSNSFADHSLPDFVETIFFANKKYIGFACMVAGVLHFIFPGFVIL